MRVNGRSLGSVNSSIDVDIISADAFAADVLSAPMHPSWVAAGFARKDFQYDEWIDVQ